MSALSFPEIRTRLQAFAKQWKLAERENADAKLFWARFYECFGIRPESATIYEKAVDKIDGTRGFIDSFIPGLLIVEHKSKGKDLHSAFSQASDYFTALPEGERPRYIIVSDFARFRLYDLRTDTQAECKLSELAKHAGWFRFLIDGDTAPAIVEESPINRQAAYAVSKLHEALLQANFRGRDLEVFLTRLLFCLFADDTGIFGQDGMFRRYVEATREDGRDTGQSLYALFDVLDTPDEERSSNLDESLAAFAYVNGSLFAEQTRIPSFDRATRDLLVKCAELDWSGISPAIFGAMFQGVLEAHTPDETRQASRRELGAHYTSERNILRVVNPLFMNDLRTEFEKARKSKPRLQALYDKLPTLTFFDPACGCGNFLVIAYRELRRLENDVIAALFVDFGQGPGLLDVSTLCRVRVNQFYGIEIDPAAAHISRVALWITDHQMNLESADRFGNTRPTVPLIDTPHVHQDNALRVDWASVLPPAQCSYVMGNPPFVGKAFQNTSQKADMTTVFAGAKSAGVLDYVAGWYIKALAYIKVNPLIDVAFVSTNSITQGEQVAALWPAMLRGGVHIRFAHRTFQWNNEGKGNAAVHCVIVGFGLRVPENCTIYDYSEDIKAETGQIVEAKRINPYLVDAANEVLINRRAPICKVSQMSFGSMPNDGGHLLLSDEDKAQLLDAEPKAESWIRPFLGAEEFINGQSRWCLWLQGISASDLRAMPEIYKRVQAVKAARLASTRETTQKLADTPFLFGEIRQPSTQYLLVPSVSSENRAFVPVGFMASNVIASNLALTIPNATLYDFALMNSTMHNAWMRSVCGRLKSDYRYSASIVYNNYPWPTPTDAQRAAMEASAQAILDARAQSPDSTMADLYDPVAMPPELRKAHAANDRAVDAAYGFKGDKSDAGRVAFLFGLYGKLTSLLPAEKPKRARKTASA
ncbi:class I SAM-dependent DNA methyltransferase [Burkholderia pseudomallei]|uniref:class I SAM-dependent DNA methyltransferase n=1 Tax=Burkholderia pseudomallei TaxID=28450 RepID=UPI0019E40B3D|nr:DNA methyltransferase [Burkholderia pseudomallei]MBF3831164.1 class I SAM-dependent DNA methyltransferase [Burkholderia pseudomallei]